MNAAELRIGNWVNYTKGGEFQGVVTSISKERVVIDHKYSIKTTTLSYHYSPPKVNGIPLTEEILLKAGFTKHEYEPGINLGGDEDEKCWEYSYKGLLQIMDWGRGEYVLSNSFSFKLRVKIKYTHHLQNLIHALTGEELNIEL